MPIEILNKTETEGEINIFGDIADEKWYDEDVTLKEIDKSLKVLSKAKQITVNINSHGGSISAGNAIIDRLNEHPAKIITNVLGIAASMGAVIAQAGDVRRIAKNSIFMVHPPMMGIVGYYYASELRKMADIADKYRETIVGTFEDRTGQSKEQIESLMDEETYMTGEEAVAFGFADELIPNKKIEAENKGGKYFVNGVEVDEKLYNKLPKNLFNIKSTPQNNPPPEPENKPDPVVIDYTMLENELILTNALISTLEREAISE